MDEQSGAQDRDLAGFHQRVLEAIMAQAAQTLGAKEGGIYLYRPARDDLKLVFAHNLPPGRIGGVLRRGEGLSGRVLQSGQPMAVTDYTHWEGRARQFENTAFPACVAVPLPWGDRVLGILYLADELERTFSADDIALLERLVPMAAAALEQMRLLEEQTALREAAAAISSSLDPYRVLARIAEQMARAIDATSAYINSMDLGEQTSTVLAEFLSPRAHPLERESDLGVTYRETDPTFLEAMAAGRPHVDELEDPLLSEDNRAHLARYGAQSVLYIPLFTAGEAIGFAELWESRRRRSFTPEEISLCQAIAQNAAIALQHARLYEQAQQEIIERKRIEGTLRQRNRELATLYETVTAIHSDLALDAALQTIAQQLAQALRTAGCALSLWDRARNILETLVDYSRADPNNTELPGTIYSLDDFPASRHVLETGCSLLVQHDDPTADAAERAMMKRYGILTLLLLPLSARGQVLGLLELYDDLAQRAYTAEEIRLAESLAAQAGGAIERARLYQVSRRRMEELTALSEVLQERSAQLQAQNEELDLFAHTVAHDLRAPLTSVIGFATTLERYYETLPQEQVYECLDAITQQGRKMVNIIEEMLVLANVREGGVEIVPLDMDRILAEAQQRLGDMIREYRAEIVLPSRWPAALGNPLWVEEVWFNYLSNAIKYGGRPPRVEAGATTQPDGLVRFWVRDDGPGLAPEEQERLFTPFTRLSQLRIEGEGLGLSIVRRIVEKLGGQVGVDSEAGAGSVFHFTLPAAEPPEG